MRPSGSGQRMQNNLLWLSDYFFDGLHAVCRIFYKRTATLGTDSVAQEYSFSIHSLQQANLTIIEISPSTTSENMPAGHHCPFARHATSPRCIRAHHVVQCKIHLNVHHPPSSYCVMCKAAEKRRMMQEKKDKA